MIFLSWRLPTAVAVFIILFDIYWLLKTVYLSFHTKSTFSIMRRNLKVNWFEKARENPEWEKVHHLVILPMHKEPYEVVRESFESLAQSNYPKEKLWVVLATEERGGADAQEVAKRVQGDFGSAFGKFLITVHPADLSGEIPGKGANETWAAKEAKRLVVGPSGVPVDKILVSVFDADTQVFPEYFGRLAYVFLGAEHPLRSVYQPIPLFTNNIYQAPPFARVVAFSATFWQMIQQSRPERLTTFSSQSVPLKALLDIGFWQTDVVSEDSRVFWQGFLRYDGDFRVEPLFYPVSMDANVAPTFRRTLANIYRQQRRWGWGCENIPYMLEGFRTNPRIPGRKKWYWSFNVLEGFHSWATNSLMIFALGWLPVFLGGERFGYTLLSYGLPQVTRFIISLSMIGIASSAVLSFLLLPPRPQWFRIRHYAFYFLEWLFIPVTLIVFGAIPGLEAQTRLMLGGKFRLGFWVTPKGRYPKVSKAL